jgi:hypothetical protein
MSGKFIDIVFDGPPSHESGRFVEVEDEHGHSINAGEWIDRGNGHWALRINVGGAGEHRPVDADDPLKKAYELGMDDAEADHHGQRKGKRSLTEVIDIVGADRGIYGDVRDSYTAGWSDWA